MESSVKQSVKKYYGGIAEKVKKSSEEGCGCSSSCCDGISSGLYDIDYIKDLPKEAISVSLGCANPVVLAELKEGETVLDLGSGGGIDVLISSKYVGSSGKVYGLDMTDEMLSLANENKEKMGVKNVEFIKGYIEDMPLKDKMVDVVMSNCVINLTENKENALREAYRVLKDGGRLAIADIIMLKDIPEDIKKSAEMWAGCIAGALNIEEYRSILKKVGFNNIEINPANVYTKDIIQDVAKNKDLLDLCSEVDWDLLDGAFAGAHVKALKL